MLVNHVCAVYYSNKDSNDSVKKNRSHCYLINRTILLTIRLNLTALWKPLMLGIRAMNSTPGRRSIPFNTASPSASYKVTISLQFGFKQQSSCSHGLFTVRTVTEHYVNKMLSYRRETALQRAL